MKYYSIGKEKNILMYYVSYNNGFLYQSLKLNVQVFVIFNKKIYRLLPNIMLTNHYGPIFDNTKIIHRGSEKNYLNITDYC